MNLFYDKQKYKLGRVDNNPKKIAKCTSLVAKNSWVKHKLTQHKIELKHGKTWQKQGNYVDSSLKCEDTNSLAQHRK